MINAVDAALEDAEIVLCVVRRNRAPFELVGIFCARVVDRMMLCELSTQLDVWRGLIGVQRAFAARVLSNDRGKRLLRSRSQHGKSERGRHVQPE